MIAREQVQQVLNAWVTGEQDELAVWQWAETAKSDGEYADELVRDIVDSLATLPFDLIVADDAAVFLDALANPAAETDLSVNLLWNHLDGINTDARRFELADHPFYGQFCDGMN